jgi:MoaA/NifB/PqqE/SkfB family radical SAM enzyme
VSDTASFADIELSPYKWATHLDRLQALAAGGDVFPVTVELDLIDACNHNCWWCVDPSHSGHALERGFVSILLDELRDLSVEGIVYKGGGEPTLHPSFAEVLAETRNKGFEVGVVTNGSQLTACYAPIIEHASYLRVSIDGPTEASHHAIHQSHDFARIVEGVRAAVALRAERGQRHPIVGLSFAMDYSMIELVPQAIRLSDTLGVDYVLLRPPFYEEVGRRPSMTTAQKQALLGAFECARSAHSGNVRVMIDYWISDADVGEMDAGGESPRRGRYIRRGANGIEHVTGTCLASPLLAVVAADRRVYPCCNLRHIRAWAVGTIDYADGQSFARVWQSERRRQVMARIHNVQCIRYCTHPMSRYNEVIAYLRSPRFHAGFV